MGEKGDRQASIRSQRKGKKRKRKKNGRPQVHQDVDKQRPEDLNPSPRRR
jgi:hypothetical protein